MSELADLERRITDALDRIGTGLEKLEPPAPAAEPVVDNAEVERLTEALEAEKTANAQLEERLKTLRRKTEARIKELEDEAADLKAAAAEAGEQLRQARHDVQAAQAAGANGTEVKALEEELQGLRRVRDEDRAELDDILASLKPLMEDRDNA